MTVSTGAIFLAGLLTFLSPCVLPLAPILIASLIQGSTRSKSRWAQLFASISFVAGFTLIFVLLGLAIPGLSSALGKAKPVLLTIAAGFLLIAGARMAGYFPRMRFFSWLDKTIAVPDFSQHLPRWLGPPVFGAVFGLTWTPCVGPILGSVLTYVAAHETSLTTGALHLFAFAMGIGLPLIVLGAASDRFLPHLARLRPYLGAIEKGIGIGLIIFGIFVLNSARTAVPSLFSAGDTLGTNNPLVALDRNGTWVHLNSETKELTRMIVFYSDTCPVCRAMEPTLDALEKDCTSQHLELIRLNIGRPENTLAKQVFRVRAVPTIAILNNRGDEVIHLVGYQTERKLREATQKTAQYTCKPSDPLKEPPSAFPALESQSCAPGIPCGDGK